MKLSTHSVLLTRRIFRRLQLNKIQVFGGLHYLLMLTSEWIKPTVCVVESSLEQSHQRKVNLPSFYDVTRTE